MNFQLPKLGKRAHRTIASLQEQSLAFADHYQGKTKGYCGRQRRLAAVDIKPDTCQWLDGEPKQRLFCGEPTQINSSYCETHHKRCYTKALPEDLE